MQFTITEVGSDLVPTTTRFDVDHNNQTIIVYSKIDILLTPAYAYARGFDTDELWLTGLLKETWLPEDNMTWMEDGDGYRDTCDCEPNHRNTYPGAREVQDGVDNQCPGYPGYGLTDEIVGRGAPYRPAPVDANRTALT